MVTVFGATGMFTNCESSATKATKTLEKEAKEDEMFAKQDVVQAQRDSAADYQNFKTQAEERIVKNSHIIADFKVRIMIGEVTMKGRCQKRLNELEKQNNNMRNRLGQYSETGTEEWETFKREWNHDMEKIVNSLNEMTKNNK